jgi:hypothetical protein
MSGYPVLIETDFNAFLMTGDRYIFLFNYENIMSGYPVLIETDFNAFLMTGDRYIFLFNSLLFDI